jgi:alpha-1,3-glucan synthase
LAFFLIGIPSIATALHPAHSALANAATWCYAIASAAGFLFFGLNFGEEAVRVIKSPLTFICISYGNSRAQLLRLGFSELALYKDPNRSGLLLCGIGVIL